MGLGRRAVWVRTYKYKIDSYPSQSYIEIKQYEMMKKPKVI